MVSGEKHFFSQFRFSDQHQNQLRIFSDNAQTRRALCPSRPDACVRYLLNANYVGVQATAHC